MPNSLGIAIRDGNVASQLGQLAARGITAQPVSLSRTRPLSRRKCRKNLEDL
uniref:AlNc14C770G12492 protein n=1 Tax=Albugo laibachii Nc14 TaxID=890382 RepID=F0X206_9STRA|nr:AlNc14C770G12492 [Albugo laibachii Nc14]|eukprot:CCA27866.1 AlNc14C770G12492 [Albugo laibachii Nc14]